MRTKTEPRGTSCSAVSNSGATGLGSPGRPAEAPGAAEASADRRQSGANWLFQSERDQFRGSDSEE
eukprot:14349-Pyramimonas_sp.AAC.1